MRPSRSIPRLLITAAGPALTLALLSGCGGSETADVGAADTAVVAGEVDATTTEEADGESEDGSPGSTDATRVCEALTAVDPDTVFADLTFGAPEPRADAASCRLPLTNAEGEGLGASLDLNGLFDLYQEQYGDNEDLYRNVDGVGDEAFILNDAQLHVRQGQEAWMVSLQALVVMADEPTMPTSESTEAGLTEIARSLLEQ
ncbi:MAG: hypothetical protein ABR616_18175 [Dermatophilaceae bacterium]|nr:hypothetical protein [Intrasporangiaceae bacterium]